MSTKPIPAEKLWTPSSLSRRFSVGTETVRYWIEREGLAALKINGRTFIESKAVDEFLASKRYEPKETPRRRRTAKKTPAPAGPF